MKYTKPFKDLSKKDADIAGGKGASLGEMLNAGIPVPDGFVVLATTFDEFLHKADLIQEVDAILEKVDHKTISSVEHASENIQELIKHANMPDDIKVEIESQFRSLDAEFVAVRSSATAEDGADHAWAGQLDSYLNTTEETLFEKVQHCWASLFTPRAIFYRFEKGLDTTKISVAVVVQKMVNSEKSGIAFSVHPVTEDRNQIIIEAGFGLGEAVVSGSVTPDSYVITKKPREIIDINVSNQTRAMYRKTGGGNEWLDIPEKGNSQVFTDSEILALAEIVMTIENHYGFPCDIEWAYEGGKFYIVQSRPITTLSQVIFPEVGADNGVVRILREDNVQIKLKEIFSTTEWDIQKFNAYPFFLSSVATLSGFNLPWGESYDHFLCITKDNNVAWHYDVKDYERLGDVFWKKINNTADVKKLREEYNVSFLKAKEEAVYIQGELKSKNVDDLKDQLSKLVNYMKLAAGYAHIIEPASYVGERKLKELGISHEDVKASESSFLQKALIYSKELLEEYNHKDAYKIFMEKYSWIQSSYLGRNEITAEHFFEFSKGEYRPHEYKELKQVEVNILAELFSWQDERKAHILESIFYTQPVLEELTTKLQLSDNSIYFLLPEEVVLLGDQEFHKELARRAEAFVDYAPNTLQRTHCSGDIARQVISELHTFEEHNNQITEIQGNSANKGIVKGVVRVCLSLESISSFQEGEVLVASMTRPEYISAMKKAIAFITDEGGITCHAAIVSRELDKPCIIGTKNATKILKDGDLVEVDADNGRIRVLEKKEESKLIIQDREWISGVTRNMSLIHQIMSGTGHYNYGGEFGLHTKHAQLAYVENAISTTVFINPENTSEYSRDILEMVSTQEKVNDLKEKYETLGKRLLTSVEKLSIDNIESWNQFQKDYEKYCAGLFLTTTLGRAGYDVLVAELEKLNFSEKEIPEIVAVITYPETHTPLFNSQYELLVLGSKIQQEQISSEEIDQEIQTWLSRYNFIPVNWNEEPWTVSDIQNQLDDLLKYNCTERAEKYIADHENKIENKIKLLQRIADKNIENIAYALSVGTCLNEYRKNIFSRVSLAYRPFFLSVAQKFGSHNWRDCYYLLPQDVAHIMQEKSLFDFEKVKKERQNIVFLINETGLQFLNPAEIEKIKNVVLTSRGVGQVQSNIKEIKGFSACKGKITGIAKVIFGVKDFHKLERGEILVTTMTSVDFVPIMEKAGAFITNEGGITSHASIVAREMNKPCIIGTKNATQILKDGDFVEVDADNGIVRILEKEKDLLDEFLKLINKKDFYPFEASLCPLFIIFPWHDGKNIKGSQSTEFPALFINGKEKCYAVIPESAYKKPSKEVFKEYIENKISIEELKKTYEPFYSYFDELYEKYVSDNFSEKTEEEIIDFMQSIYKDYSAMIGRTLFIETLDYDIALEILQDKELLDKVWEQSTHPYFESFELRQKRIIKSLAQKNSSKGELVNKIMFIFTDYYKPKSKDFVSSEIEKILEEKIPEYCCDANFVEWKSNLNNKEKKIVEYLQFIMEARDVRKDPIAKVQYLLYLAASEIARRADLEEKLVVHLTGFEYSQGIRWIQEHKFEIQERYEGQVSFIDNEGNIIIKKANYQKSLEEFIQKTSSISKDKKNIYGQIASPGVIQGTVRIILDAQNKDNIFNQGDILVTSMTRPEFVPLMKKAGAVITNEGGITCHAAIISRELGIPCVIGTKFATQILKDGDEVEVDANNGVVRIINKK